jgi:hypothetical protein
VRPILPFALVNVLLALALSVAAASASDQLSVTEIDNDRLAAELVLAHAEAGRAPGLVQLRNDHRATEAAHLAVLPACDLATRERLLVALQQHAESAPVRIARLALEQSERPLPGGGALVELQATLDVAGTFEDVVRFVGLVEADPAVVQVRTFALVPAEGSLQAALGVSTWRYRAGPR